MRFDGAAAELMRQSVDYAKLRHQFGRPIGAFQAVKHKLADMAFDVERMDSIVRHAATVAATGSRDWSEIAAIAKVFCSEAFFRVAAETIQIHGGIGFTWEHPAHLYFRRAKSSEYLLGSPAAHREYLLQAFGRMTEPVVSGAVVAERQSLVWPAEANEAEELQMNRTSVEISVNQALCVGNAMCRAIAPDSFIASPNGRSSVADAEAHDLELVIEAADTCPVAAINVTTGEH